MRTVLKTFNFDDTDKSYELLPYRHYGKNGYIIEVSTHEKKWKEPIFFQHREQAIEHILKMLFLTPTARDKYRRDLNRYPYFSIQALSEQTCGFVGSYTLSLTGSRDNFDFIYDDLIDVEFR